MAQFRYRSSKIPQGTTHRALQWLGEENQISAVVGWVAQNLEPLHADHIVVSETDILDLTDTLAFEFEDVISFGVIEQAIYELPFREYVRRGHPKAGRSDVAISSPPSYRFGGPRELQARARLIACVDRLDDAIRGYKSRSGGQGDNGPADLIELDPDAPPSIKAIETAAAALRSELAKSTPSTKAIQRSAKRIQVWGKVWKWFKEKADRAVNSVVDKAGDIFVMGVVASGLLAAGDLVAECACDTHSTANAWVQAAQDDHDAAEPAKQEIHRTNKSTPTSSR